MFEPHFSRSRRVALGLRPILQVGPFTGSGLVSAARRSGAGGVPAVRASWRSTAELAVDEFLIAAQSAVRRVPDLAALRRGMVDVDAAAAALADLRPGDLYRAVDAQDVVANPAGDRRHSWELLTFSTPIDLPAVLTPGVGRRTDQTALRARIRLLRHAEPRPWVIVVHGALMGRDSDLLALRARHLHERLGFNLALPVLPLHGPRGTSPATTVPGLDVLTNVATALTAVAEVRALRRWIAESHDDPPVGLFGVSLGGYITALTAGVERDFDVIVAAIPVVNPHELIARHVARNGSREAREVAAMLRSPSVVAVERFVDPLHFQPSTPVQHRHVLGGLLDSVTTPHQAADLARHWGIKTVQWYAGGHVGHIWSADMRADVDAALIALHSTPAVLSSVV